MFFLYYSIFKDFLSFVSFFSREEGDSAALRPSLFFLPCNVFRVEKEGGGVNRKRKKKRLPSSFYITTHSKSSLSLSAFIYFGCALYTPLFLLSFWPSSTTHPSIYPPTLSSTTHAIHPHSSFCVWASHRKKPGPTTQTRRLQFISSFSRVGCCSVGFSWLLSFLNIYTRFKLRWWDTRLGIGGTRRLIETIG